jgi:hypothetical protein
MTTFVLEMRSTANWDDVRYREYTTSKKKADLFRSVPKIGFTDSSHGIIPTVKEHRGRREPRNMMLQDHVVDAITSLNLRQVTSRLRRTRLHGDVIEALTQAAEYFEDRADVVDGSYGEPSPNKEMSLAQLCSDALDRVALGWPRAANEKRIVERCAKIAENLRHPDYSAESPDWCAGTAAAAAAIRALNPQDCGEGK